MRIYLVQHGEAKSEQEDAERPLSDAGCADTKRMAEFLTNHCDITVESIVHSGKKRAEQTAEILAGYIKPNSGICMAVGLKPLDDPMLWLEKLSRTKDDVMLVGHLPHLNRLAGMFLGKLGDDKVFDFKTSGVLCMGRNEPGHWYVCWMVIPSMLKS